MIMNTAVNFGQYQNFLNFYFFFFFFKLRLKINIA